MQADLFTAPAWRDALAALREQGLLRDLDVAVAEFLHRQAPEAEPAALLLAALTSGQLAAGHLCLDLDEPGLEARLWPAGRPPALDGLLPAASGDWPALLNGSPLVGAGDDNAPLVFDGGRLYLRRHWAQERAVAERVQARLATGSAPDPARLAGQLTALFPEPAMDGEPNWQQVACALAARAGLTLITGGPGTGKTTTVVRVLGLLQTLAMQDPAAPRRLRIRLAAPTGKAAARLTESIGRQVAALPVAEAVRAAIPTQVATLHRLLGSRPDSRHFRHHRHNPVHADVVVVDEASMIDMDMMASLLDALPTDCRLILLGDKDQLASVEAGAVMGDLCREADAGRYRPATLDYVRAACGADLSPWAGDGAALAQQTAMLRRNWRFKDAPGIGDLAAAINAGDPRAVERVFGAGHPGLTRVAGDSPHDLASRLLNGGGENGEGLRALVADAAAPAAGDPDQRARDLLRRFTGQQLLSGLRGGPFGVERLNRLITDHLHREGLAGDHDWYPGRPVMMTRNDYQLGLMNGDVGLTLPHPERPEDGLRVAFQLPDGRVRWVPPGRLDAVETVFAMTVHKSQGSEFGHVLLVLPDRPQPLLTRELVYTAVTRARGAFTLLEYGPPSVLAQAIKRRTWRASGLAERLAAGAPLQV
ncbi:exodeoxyribonuclease V subunit alpha [Alcanivorax marinus]|uniref:RecBCD enzyme subunit RecD n=3 Tax=Alloalcanivorax marinus TaxID=1177169 RepID=A0A9Q3UQ03_9GAMM|nr:exodeoxyribonuclease V subunit alpha [Alloalcanivorax marinus]MBM7335589.1 exodeoxyribonuclease V subunit alpha [Alloalcanivorax marinus]MCC4309394.1 exodeoxyribonuclease V subunit alpha [Alloalcanivorax marinus]